MQTKDDNLLSSNSPIKRNTDKINLKQAIYYGDTSKVISFLNSNGNPNTILTFPQHDSVSALEFWVLSGNENLIGYHLITAGAKTENALRLCHDHEEYAFFEVQIIDALSKVPTSGQKPTFAELNLGFSNAMRNQNLQLAEEYLKAGANPYFIDESFLEVVKEQAKLKGEDLYGFNSIVMAIVYNDAPLVELLLNYGVDPNSKYVPIYDDAGKPTSSLRRACTPLQEAILRDCFDCIEVMIEAGAHVGNEDLQCVAMNNNQLDNLLLETRQNQKMGAQIARKESQRKMKQSLTPSPQKIDVFFTRLSSALSDKNLSRAQILDFFAELKKPSGVFYFLHLRKHTSLDNFRLFFKAKNNLADSHLFWHTSHYQRAVVMLQQAYLKCADSSAIHRQKEENDLLDYVVPNASHRKDRNDRNALEFTPR